MKKFYKEILIFLFFIFLTFLWTYPLVFRMHTGIFSDPEWMFDSLGSLHGIWWQKCAWLNGFPSTFNHLVAFPFGVNTSRQVTQPCLVYPLLVLSLWQNELFAHNFLTLVSFVLSAVFSYCLLYYLTKNKLASMVSGLIFSFPPNHFLQAFSHLDQAQIQWMPLYVLSLLILNEQRSYRSAFFLAFTFSMVTLSCAYLGYFMVIFTVGFILFNMYKWGQSGKKRNRNALRKYVKIILVAVSLSLIIILPFYWLAIETILSPSKLDEAVSSGYVRPLKDLYKYSARVSDYFAPSEYHPIFGKIDFWFMKPYTKPSRHWAERTLYLGMMPLFLTVYGVMRWWKRKKRKMSSGRENFIIPFFIFSAFLAFLFSLTPTVNIFGIPIPTPSFFMHKIAPMFRCSCRFGTVVILCISVLAGFGIKELLGRVQNKGRRVAVSSFIIGFILFEFTVIPPFRNVDLSKTPPVYKWLASEPSDVVIAEYPWIGSIQEKHYEYLFYQRVHQKRMVNGAPGWTFGEAVRKQARKIGNPETASILSYLGAKYVIVHKDAYNSGDIEKINGNPDLVFVKNFPSAIVYEVVTESPELVTIFWKSFAMWERWDDGSVWRWAGNNATMWLCNTMEENIQIDFKFTVLSFYRGRTLRIFLNDKLIKSMQVQAPSDISLAHRVSLKNLELKPGENIIKFFTPQGTDKIDDILHNGDQRMVSLAFSNFKIKKR